jgi:hypothetical protein
MHDEHGKVATGAHGGSDEPLRYHRTPLRRAVPSADRFDELHYALKTSKLTTTLTYNGNDSWEGTAADYDEAYELSVISGADKVTGVIVDGPDIHEFTSPTMGATLDSTVANNLKWDRAAAADQATLRVGDLQRIAISDTGTFSIAPGTLRSDATQARPNTLVLTRENDVVPKGAVPGSSFAVSVDNELDVVAQPTM